MYDPFINQPKRDNEQMDELAKAIENEIGFVDS